MTNKKLTYLNKLSNFFSKNHIEDTEKTQAFIKSMLTFDYNEGIDLWELVALKSNLIDKDIAYNKMITNDILQIFCDKGTLKTYKMLIATPTLITLLFERNQNPIESAVLEFVTHLLLTSKVDNLESVFRSMLKNTTTDYGKNMRTIFEHYMDLLISKQDGQMNASIPKKVRTILIFFIKKIKGEEKALLLQRINEIS